MPFELPLTPPFPAIPSLALALEPDLSFLHMYYLLSAWVWVWVGVVVWCGVGVDEPGTPG